jgi:hypothetical protein
MLQYISLLNSMLRYRDFTADFNEEEKWLKLIDAAQTTSELLTVMKTIYGKPFYDLDKETTTVSTRIVRTVLLYV